ncbi:Stigma-specific protein, Stig1 [Musa troglodytarum]|uniref:Stigma-specific protein, Stig1 n=1 Tax=Musa troglodytarum TaxID=320322 RepID=A0A9E7EZC1_9LILI|nr:Stigma-specific protein, Stig1 [Musa troglodytarum]
MDGSIDPSRGPVAPIFEYGERSPRSYTELCNPYLTRARGREREEEERMATTCLSPRSLLVTLLLLALASVTPQRSAAAEVGDPRARSRFLAQEAVKKGARCDPVTNNRCSGLQARDGTQLLYCCKKRCRNVLSDRNNCGACGLRCGFGQLCCKGKCTAVAYDVNNCGKCGTVCQPGLRCEYARN